MRRKITFFILLTVFTLTLPWFNAMTSQFVIKGDLSERSIHIVGSNGRYISDVNYNQGTQVVDSGYYASFLNTLFMFKLNQNKFSSVQVLNLNEFLHEHQTFFVLKLQHISGNEYMLKHIEEDPRKGVTKEKVIVEGNLGIL
ncbi:hypothetical protein [Vibrio campbellii]|uniref:hypothetical protein n=1 Tax=Vibrio campbellii TaxID=680 RepID=UPI0005EE6628|nr:hypothetical protein [Vibrio campbellii]